MRKSFTVIALLTVSLISVFGQGNTTQNAPNAADEAAIRALVQKCIEGWNKGSGEAFAAQFAEDSDFVVGNGTHLKGRKQNASNHQQIFDTFFKGTRLWLQVKSVRFLRPDVALVHTLGKVLKPGESDASPEPETIQAWMVSKHGNEWVVDAFHNTFIQRQGGPTSKP
ncbi:MAG TPA: SgcJ/EcaC family oxidoreductase [Pyrinomonadaceae bacterium]|nr:SgcJ/EcaC family oxidoreductase [Pyrinomonadaceae bacterium]